MRRRGTSPWLKEQRNRTLDRMLPCVAERIATGEDSLEVWAQQQCVPLKTIARKTKIEMWRLLDVVRGCATLASDEVEAVAKELRIASHLLCRAEADGRPDGEQ